MRIDLHRCSYLDADLDVDVNADDNVDFDADLLNCCCWVIFLDVACFIVVTVGESKMGMCFGKR